MLLHQQIKSLVCTTCETVILTKKKTTQKTLSELIKSYKKYLNLKKELIFIIKYDGSLVTCTRVPHYKQASYCLEII